MPASASAATSAGLVDGSSFTQARAVVRRYSAMPPSLFDSPGKKAFSHCMSRPARQAMHRPQLRWGCRITVSPTATLGTPSRSEEHTPELHSRQYLVCRLLLANKKIHQALW